MTLPVISPAGLFDVRGKSALIVGATGAFGKVVCATLGAAGARLTIAAGRSQDLAALAQELVDARIEARSIALRPDGEENAAAIAQAAVESYGAIDILVVA